MGCMGKPSRPGQDRIIVLPVRKGTRRADPRSPKLLGSQRSTTTQKRLDQIYIRLRIAKSPKLRAMAEIQRLGFDRRYTIEDRSPRQGLQKDHRYEPFPNRVPH